MSGLCGWLDAAPGGVPGERRLAAMAQGLTRDAQAQDSSATADQGRAALLTLGRSGGASVEHEDGILASLAGAPWWSDDALARIAAARGHAAALLAGWRRAGRGVLDQLHGAFVCAVLEPSRRAGLLAVDRMGIGRLCYALPPEGGLVFGSTTDAVRGHPAVGDALSEQGIFNYLFFYVSPAPGTIYRDQQKLRAAQCLEFTAGRATTDFYWRMPYVTNGDGEGDARALAAELMAQLRTAHRRALDGLEPERSGAFLSGGLDSSTVAGMLAEISSGAIKTFTIGFDVPGYDESAFAEAAVRRFGTAHHRYYVTPEDVLALVPRIAEAYDEPFGNSSAVPAYYCARLAREHGVSVMFAGDGGDELFGGNERYVESGRFAFSGRLPGWLNDRTVMKLLDRLPADGAVSRKIRALLTEATMPVPDRLYRTAIPFVVPPAQVFVPEFLARVDPREPLRLARDPYARTGSPARVHRMMHLDHQLTLADNDLRKVTRMCALAGVDVRFPLLDDELVAFSARVPPDLLLRDGRLRGFYKDALTGFLPDAVITKQKHGFGLPTGKWLCDHAPLRTFCIETLDGFRQRGQVHPRFVDRLVTALADGHDPVLLGAAWDIMILELWLRTRRLGARHAG